MCAWNERLDSGRSAHKDSPARRQLRQLWLLVSLGPCTMGHGTRGDLDEPLSYVKVPVEDPCDPASAGLQTVMYVEAV